MKSNMISKPVTYLDKLSILVGALVMATTRWRIVLVDMVKQVGPS